VKSTLIFGHRAFPHCKSWVSSRRLKLITKILAALFFVPLVVFAQETTAPNQDSATFDSDGTAHATRVVPMPSTVSPEAQLWLKEIEHETPQPEDLAEIRARTDHWQCSTRV
jgi:epsilon-lactone hydrolase